MIEILERIITNNFLILIILVLGYFGRESIKNFFAEKLWDKQQEYNNQRDIQQQEYNNGRDRKQEEFQRELSKQNATLQKEIQDALEKQRTEFQKELKAIDYKNDYYKKIIDKRIEAYEKLYSIISYGAIYEVLKDERFCSFFKNENKFFEYHEKQIDYLYKDLFWFSEKAENIYVVYVNIVGCIKEYILGNKNYLIDFLKSDKLKMYELMNTFNDRDIENEITEVKKCLDELKFLTKENIEERYDSNIISIGIVLYPLLKEVHKCLFEIIEKDFQHLDEVEKFLKKEQYICL